jgi:hypothetical protein
LEDDRRPTTDDRYGARHIAHGGRVAVRGMQWVPNKSFLCQPVTHDKRVSNVERELITPTFPDI